MSSVSCCRSDVVEAPRQELEEAVEAVETCRTAASEATVLRRGMERILTRGMVRAGRFAPFRSGEPSSLSSSSGAAPSAKSFSSSAGVCSLAACSIAGPEAGELPAGEVALSGAELVVICPLMLKRGWLLSVYACRAAEWQGCKFRCRK